MKKIVIIAGARPNFMKIAPIIRAIEKDKEKFFEYKLVHTGQHYDKNMSDIFFEELNIPKPDINLGIGSGSQAKQVAEIMIKLEDYLLDYKPDYVLVVGDVNSTLAAGIVASKLGIKLIHVEAGLRSFDREMPEEINRLVTDQLSDILFVSEKSGLKNLKKENIPKERCFFVGNVMIDSLVFMLPKLKKEGKDQKSAIVTIHRPSNVDNKEDLLKILQILKEVSKEYKIIWPIHPRTKKNIENFGLIDEIKDYDLREPLGYIEFMNLVYNSGLIVTDSGGIQEETTYLGIPCITLRNNTERPVTVSEGTNQLTGPIIEKVIDALNKIKSGNYNKNPKLKFWDGKAAKRIIKVLKKTAYHIQ